MDQCDGSTIYFEFMIGLFVVSQILMGMCAFLPSVLRTSSPGEFVAG